MARQEWGAWADDIARHKRHHYYGRLLVAHCGSISSWDDARMDDAVARELETMLGFMRACQTTVADVETGHLPAPPVPSPAGYVCRMTWAQASGALRMLEQLQLISHEEREAWEREAGTVVDRQHA